VCRTAHVHVLDEPHLGVGAPAELHEVDQLIVVDAPDDHGVELQTREPGRPDGLDPPEDGGVVIPPRERPEALRTEGVEADRDPVEAGLPERRGLAGEQDTVARHREVLDGGNGREQADQVRQVPTEERLPARQPDLVDAELGEDVHQAPDLLEGEEVPSTEPGVLLLRHAVLAAEVAPVRHRHPEAPERASEHVPQVRSRRRHHGPPLCRR
jgi:hypothetical protein